MISEISLNVIFKLSKVGNSYLSTIWADWYQIGQIKTSFYYYIILYYLLVYSTFCPIWYQTAPPDRGPNVTTLAK